MAIFTNQINVDAIKAGELILSGAFKPNPITTPNSTTANEPLTPKSAMVNTGIKANPKYIKGITNSKTPPYMLKPTMQKHK